MLMYNAMGKVENDRNVQEKETKTRNKKACTTDALNSKARYVPKDSARKMKY